MADTNARESKVRVTDIVAISALTPTDEEEGVRYQAAGDIPRPGLIDHAIEERTGRERIPANGGLISITVQPGEALGQLHINVQFEGPYGQYDVCLENQGDLLTRAADWLGEFLKDLGGAFDVKIVAKPCPKTDKRLPLKHAAAILTGEQPVQRQHKIKGTVVIDARATHQLTC